MPCGGLRYSNDFIAKLKDFPKTQQTNSTTIIKVENLIFKAIMMLFHLCYELMITSLALCTMLVIYHLLSNVCWWNNI